MLMKKTLSPEPVSKPISGAQSRINLLDLHLSRFTQVGKGRLLSSTDHLKPG